MHLLTITYGGRVEAAASARGMFLCLRLALRPVEDPERTLVIYMGAYAGDVLRGELPGPYSDEQARQYARVALIPEELLEHDLPDLERTARALQIPASELRQARVEHDQSLRTRRITPQARR